MTVPVPSHEDRMKQLLAAIGERGLCRGCAAPITWITHRNGKKTPYDAEGATAGVNHWITCKNSEQFRKSTR